MDKKNIIVAKFGGSNGRICFGKYDKNHNLKNSRDITSGCTEAKTIIEMLDRSGKFNISILTKILDGDYLPEKYSFYNSLELINQDMQAFLDDKKIDYMFVINGSINCFGGVEESMIPDLCIYKMMHYFSGKIIYCQCDLAINMLADVYDYISSKPWSSKYNKEELDISTKKLYMFTQAHDIDAHMKNINKGKNYKFDRDHVVNFPFEKYPYIMPFTAVDKNDSPDFDLGYGGTLRGGRRMKKIAKYYFNQPDLKVYLYGKIEDDKMLDLVKKTYGEGLIMPVFGGVCNFVDNGKVLNRALATVVIGDAIFEETQTVQQRAYQAVRANVVTFIDEDLDKSHYMYGSNSNFSKFMYVNNPDDLAKRIEHIKKTPGLREKLLECQRRMLDFNIDNWIDDLANKIIS